MARLRRKRRSMYMTVNDFLRGIVKYKAIPVFLVALSVLLCSVFGVVSRTDTAEVIIKYLGDDAKQGLTPRGETLNPYEINSAIVVQNALDALGMTSTSAESICRYIDVQPIVSLAEEEKYDSWIENFADYENSEEEKAFPVYYSVTFKSSFGRDYAKIILNEIVRQYRMYYSENHINNVDVTNLEGEAALQHDYYETADMLRTKITAYIEYLRKVISNGKDYRSAHTGYSLSDLVSKFTELNNTELAVANRMILSGGISKDFSYFHNTLSTRIVEQENKQKLNSDEAATSKSLMELYAQKNSEYLWDYNDSDEEGNASNQHFQVDNDVERNTSYDTAVAIYDQLALDYVDYRTQSENAAIQKELYETVEKAFENPTADDVDVKEVESLLQTACDKFNRLYQQTKVTLDDYNSWQAGQNIVCVSDIIVYDASNPMFYYVVSIALAVFVGLGLSILIELLEVTKSAKEEKRKNGTPASA